MPSATGVGIDLAERRSYSHLDDAAISRTAARWLHPGEHAWCTGRPSFRESLVIVLSCKEAAFKALGRGGALYQLSLRMSGTATTGWATARQGDGVQVLAFWDVSSHAVLSVALAGSSVAGAREILEEVRSNLRAGPTP